MAQYGVKEGSLGHFHLHSTVITLAICLNGVPAKPKLNKTKIAYVTLSVNITLQTLVLVSILLSANKPTWIGENVQYRCYIFFLNWRLLGELWR